MFIYSCTVFNNVDKLISVNFKPNETKKYKTKIVKPQGVGPIFFLYRKSMDIKTNVYESKCCLLALHFFAIIIAVALLFFVDLLCLPYSIAAYNLRYDLDPVANRIEEQVGFSMN